MKNLSDLLEENKYNTNSNIFETLDPNINQLTNFALTTIKQNKDTVRKGLALKYDYPASLKMAQKHTNAIKYGQCHKTCKKRVICPCCSLQIDTKPYSFFKDNTTVIGQLNDFRLTSCVAFFFTFIKFLIVLFIARILILDIFNIITNLVDGEFCEDKCSKQLWSLASIIHKYNRQDLVHVTNILVLVVCIIFIILFICYRPFLYSMYEKIDNYNQTQDDFSIFVENIPILDFPSKLNQNKEFQFDYDKDLDNFMTEKIQNWLKNIQDYRSKPGSLEKDYVDYLQEDSEKIPDDIVKSISLCYDLSPLEKISKLRQQLMKIHTKNIAENKENQLHLQDRFDDHLAQIQFLNQSQIELCARFASQKDLIFKTTHFVGSAFVSFKYQHYRDYILQLYDANYEEFKFKDNYLKVQKASFPSDVKWKNIKIGDSQRRNRVLASYGILLSVIVIAFCILIGSDKFKNFLLEKLNEDKVLEEKIQAGKIQEESAFGHIDWGSMSITLVTTIITLAINYLLQILAYILTDWERHQSMAKEKSSLVVKLLITQFLNTAMIYLALSKIRGDNNDELMSQEGLVYQISSLLVLSGFIQIVTNLINFGEIIQWVYLKYLLWGTQPNNIPLFQVELNREYQFLQFDIAQKYSYYLLQLYMVAFYSYIMPIIVPAVAVIFFLQYWVDKFNLFKRSSMFYELQYSLTEYMVKMAEFSIFLFALGAFFFSYRITDYFDPILIVNLVLTSVFFIISIFASEKTAKQIFRRNERCEQYEYDQCIRDRKFTETYWIKNPATSLVDQQLVSNRKCVQNVAAREFTIKERSQNDSQQVADRQEQKEQQNLGSSIM